MRTDDVGFHERAANATTGTGAWVKAGMPSRYIPTTSPRDGICAPYAGRMSVDPSTISVGDKVQAPTGAGGWEQYIGVVTAINGDLVTFLAEGAYDMYCRPGDEDYYWDLPEPLECVRPLSEVTYHWPKDE